MIQIRPADPDGTLNNRIRHLMYCGFSHRFTEDLRQEVKSNTYSLMSKLMDDTIVYSMRRAFLVKRIARYSTKL